MINKNKYCYLLIMINFIILSSCRKFLDKPPDNSYAYPTTVENLQALLDNPQFNLLSTPELNEISANDYFLTEAGYNTLNFFGRPAYVWEELPVETTNDWKYCYGNVYAANVAIDQIDKIDRRSVNESAWDNVKGSGYFFRAYYFLQLVWTYAKAYDPTTSNTDLGIVLRKTTDVNALSVRANVEECYQQIIADVLVAVNYLPNLPVHPFRPSKAAAYGLLARAYLSMRDYANAHKYADLALRLKSDLIDFNSDNDLTMNPDSTLPSIKQFNKETIFYTEMVVSSGVFAKGIAMVDTSIVASYNDNDLRKSILVFGASNTKRFKGSYAQNTQVMFTGLATDELLLIRAESAARAGELTAAANDLNTLLVKRWKTGTYNPLTFVNVQDAVTKILSERRKELIFRGLRWIDIKRLNKEGANIILKRKLGTAEYTLLPNENRYALPIPKDIIELTGMPQNPR